MIKTRTSFKIVPPDRVKDLPQLLSRAPIIFTNGCFDVLHTGHVCLLNFCARLGAVVVGLNSDESVRTLKGEGRPIQSQEDRAAVLSGLEAVKAVAVFDSPRCDELIRTIRPEVYVKGGDYTLATLDPQERMALEEVGAEIVFFATVPGKSTTAIASKLEENT